MISICIKRLHAIMKIAIATILTVVMLSSANAQSIKVRRQPNINSATWLPTSTKEYHWLCQWQNEDRVRPVLKVYHELPVRYEAALLLGHEKSKIGLIRVVKPGFTYEDDGWIFTVTKDNTWSIKQKRIDEQFQED